MTPKEEIFSEIRETMDTRIKIRVRYARLYALLGKICSEHTVGFAADYSGLFSRLYAVCQEYQIENHAADRFRRNARLVLKEQKEADENEFLDDVADLALFVSQLYHCPRPENLPVRSVKAREKEAALPGGERYAKMRVVVEEIGEEQFTCLFEGETLTVDVAENPEIIPLLKTGATVNLVEAIKAGKEVVADVIILEPDYLIDVSALTACIRPYGSHPLNYFLSRLVPREITLPILLGNAANQFMDDCINKGTESNYREAMQQHFHDSMLDYIYSDDEVTTDYFAKAQEQFGNIRSSVLHTFPSHEVGINPEEVLLEPSFICETLGLRGRLDVMTADGHRLVELKSGKAEGYGPVPPHPREEHVMQMSLYKEMLHHNLGLKRDSVGAYLFYSTYPAFFHQRSSAQAIRHVLQLRNEIVYLEQQLRYGHFDDYLPMLFPDVLNTKQMDNRFYHDYLQPQIEKMVMPLQNMNDLVHRYFTAFLAFIYREQFLSKTNDNRPDSTRGFARTWTADLTTKLLSGDILINLRMVSMEGEKGVERVVFSMPDYGENFIANFNIGEMVQLYERTEKKDGVTNRQLVRGNIEHIDAEQITLMLAYPQREHYFSRQSLYAIEHDSSDASFQQALRGIYSLLMAEDDRRDLLLCQRLPAVDLTRQLVTAPLEAVRNIVLQAKQAKDYFLLVGPPGTGKTNVALRSMVCEFLLSAQAERKGEAILLMAYTNRAVDEICGMLEGLLAAYSFADYVRIGSEGTCAEPYRRRLLKNRGEGLKNREAARQFMDCVPIVVGTVMTLTNHLNLIKHKRFRVALIDEASQVLEPQLLGLLTAGKPFPFIMIGDHKQLPAVVMQSPEQSAVHDELLQSIGLNNLRNSLFERLYLKAQQEGCTYATARLTHQGRMHPDICDFVSREFYEDHLYALDLPHQCGELSFKHPAATGMEEFLSMTRLGFIDVKIPEGMVIDNPKANAAEAAAVAEVVVAWAHLLGEEYSSERIGIIVPFRAQIGRVRAALRRNNVGGWDKITVDTVECYQGSQRDFILFSTTISRRGQLAQLSELHPIEGVEVDRKLNVAITRARRQFIMVGNRGVLQYSALYSRLMTESVTYLPG